MRNAPSLPTGDLARTYVLTKMKRFREMSDGDSVSAVFGAGGPEQAIARLRGPAKGAE